MSNIFLISLFVLIIGVLVNYLVIKNYQILNLSILLDKEYFKPQSFHKKPILCFGGISIYILFITTILFFEIKSLNHFFLIGTASFLMGLIEDLRIKLRPILRLILFLLLFFIIISYLNIDISNLAVNFLNKIFEEYNYFKIIFITLCFVFIINGANFVDGFNGLLTIHSLIILSIINLINYYFFNYDLLIFGIISFFSILSFAIFNFPKAKLFLGDSGSYLIGSLISYLVIQTSNYNSNISSFFFSCLLYYLFFEVFFSFFRKLFYEKKNPLIPDKYHFHMLLFYKIKKSSVSNPNFITSFFLNFIYLLTLLPTFYFYNENLFLNYYFFLLIIIYTLSYFKLRK
jgi:UDP-N-acetylmuramyl pentapeptide phosphotransferase/UDP-N-acetylglucosamine-1-phosphate transferase